jgi:ABC-2 type transport system permease protein
VNPGAHTLGRVPAFWQQALHIAAKDVRIYYLKGPNLTFGLLLPAILYGVYALGGDVTPASIAPGMIAAAVLFGAGAMQAVSLPMERSSGSIHLLLSAPMAPHTLALGKVLAGAAFGVLLALVYAVLFATMGRVPIRPVAFALSTVVAAFTASALGLAMAAPFGSVPDAMPPATVVRMAMLFVSGALRPLTGGPPALALAMRLVPLTSAVEAYRAAMSPAPLTSAFFLNMTAQAIFGMLFLYIAGALIAVRDR